MAPTFPTINVIHADRSEVFNYGIVKLSNSDRYFSFYKPN